MINLIGKKLKPEIKKRWQKALGEYPQAKNKLRTPDGFCCLGVLGDLAVKDGLATWNESLELVVNDYKEDIEFPECLLSWAFEDINLNTKDIPTSTSFEYTESGTSLAGDNDTGTSFAEISQLIEEHF
jgi:hypothetical protein